MIIEKKDEDNRKLLDDNIKLMEIIAKLTNKVDEIMDY
jgi:hypothetical protein